VTQRRRSTRGETRAPTPRRPRGAFPIAWLTAGGIVVGVLLVMAFAFFGGGQPPAPPATSTGSTAGSPSPPPTLGPLPTTGLPIATPAAVKPAEFAFGRSLGRPDAPVQLDLWVDYQCPACGRFYRSIEPALVQVYIQTGKVRLNFHDFAFIGPESTSMAIGARCAERQGSFWAYHDLLFANLASPENGGAFTRERLTELAAALGLDVDAFWTCLDDPDVADAVRADTTDAYDRRIPEIPWLLVAGVNARPATSWQAITTAIDAALAAAASPTP
jgi:predicted DsbA family dithiol-disulfide isomerase